MANAAVYVFAAVAVFAVAGLIAIFTTKPQPMNHGRRNQGSSTKYRPPSPPPTPPPSSARRRRKSPVRRSNSPARDTANEQPVRNSVSSPISSNPSVNVSTSTNEQLVKCKLCGESLHIKVNPCTHETLCKGCFMAHLENNDTCPDCHGRIDSCSPPIPSFGKCISCRRFTKLFKFLDCNHSLSLCIKCFEEQNESYKVCPECKQKIKGSEPSYPTSGVCGVCGEFARFAMFEPCGHGNFCRRHASQYLEISGKECSECSLTVSGVAF